MQSKLKCAVYTRVSTDNQAEVEFNSCEAQEEKIKSFINSQETMAIYKVYSDPGFTGANLNRPGFQKMLDDLRQGKFKLIIAYKIDRLTRSPKDFYSLIEAFDQHGVDFISVTERFDTFTPSGRLLRNIMLTFAQFERELASERTKDKMMQRVQKGMWNGGLTPFGYKVENKKLVIDEAAAGHVRAIYQDHISGVSVAQSAKAAGISKSRLFSVLRNPVYAGKIRYAGSLWQGNHPAIISEETYHLAQGKHLKARRTMRPYKNYAFAGLVKCKECGSHMSPCHTNKKKDKRTKRYYYYRCTSTFKKDWNACSVRQINSNRLDNYIQENLERISLDRQYLENMAFSFNHGRAGGGRIGLPKIKAQKFEESQVLGVAGGRGGLELAGDTSIISTEILAQTLARAAKALSEFRGPEKNALCRKIFESLEYSKESIQINVRILPESAVSRNENARALCTGASEEKYNGSPARSRTSNLLVTVAPQVSLRTGLYHSRSAVKRITGPGASPRFRGYSLAG